MAKALTIAHDKIYGKTNYTQSRYDAISQYLDGDKFILKMFYTRPDGLPILYHGKDRFKGNDSKEFYESLRHQILVDYLGPEYEEYQAELSVVTEKDVGIIVKIDTLNQLIFLLSDRRVNASFHVGNYGIENFVLIW